jgi:hypothetical protein
MHLLRERLGSGVRLALFALAVQLVASFAHFHRDDLPAPAPEQATGSRVAGAPAGSAQSRSGQSDNRDHGCTICASIALAGALDFPEPPAIRFAPAYRQPWLPEHLAPVTETELRASFQARAPPV